MSQNSIVTITHPVGFHARPAVKFTKLAKTFGSNIEIRSFPDGQPVDAKSIVKVMALKLKTGTKLEICASGQDEDAAISELSNFVVRNFDES